MRTGPFSRLGRSTFPELDLKSISLVAATITTDRKLGVYGAVDCGLFVQTFLLAAHSLGVATIPQAAIASQAPFIRQHFALPDDRMVLLGVSFGFADESHPANGYRTPRQSVSELVTWHPHT